MPHAPVAWPNSVQSPLILIARDGSPPIPAGHLSEKQTFNGQRDASPSAVASTLLLCTLFRNVNTSPEDSFCIVFDHEIGGLKKA